MLKKLKSLFIVEEEVPASKVTKGTKSKGGSSATKAAPKTKAPSIPVDASVEAPGKFINSLLGAIEANNLEGFDYLEYKQSLKSLQNMDMDEATRFNSAYAMAQTMGAKRDSLVSSANHYIKILEEEKAKFTAAYEKQQEKQVVSREEKLVNIQTSIQKKEAQIKKLQAEIQELKKEYETKKKEINTASAKVALTRDQFFAAHKKVNDQIVSDIERMKKYLTK